MVERIDRATGQVLTFALPPERSGHACAAAGDFFVIAGGRETCQQPPCTLSRLDVYHEPSGTWLVDSLPLPVTLATGGSIGDKIVIAGGGEIGGPPQGIVQILDTVSWTWTIVDIGPRSRLWTTVLSDERWLCIAGGEDQQGPIGRVDIYDSWADTWGVVDIPAPVPSAAGAALIDGRIYTGWGTHVPFDPLHARDLHVLDLATRTWSTRTVPRIRIGPHVSSAGPYLIAAHGHSGVHLGSVDVLDTLTGDWHTFMLPVASSRALARDPAGDAIYISGGEFEQQGNQKLDRIDVFRISESLGQTFCGPAHANSSGLPARIAAVGLDVTLENFITLYVEDAPVGALGMFLASETAAAPVVPSGSHGALCLGAPVSRLGYSVRAVDERGVLATSLRLDAPPFQSPLLALVGARWHFQAWFRDEHLGSPTSNFSDALQIDFR